MTNERILDDNTKLIAKKLKTDTESNKELALKIQEWLQKNSKHRYIRYTNPKLRTKPINCTDSPKEERLKKEVEILKYFYGE